MAERRRMGTRQWSCGSLAAGSEAVRAVKMEPADATDDQDISMKIKATPGIPVYRRLVNRPTAS